MLDLLTGKAEPHRKVRLGWPVNSKIKSKNKNKKNKNNKKESWQPCTDLTDRPLNG
jgi:hypothetical protein